MYDMAGNPLYNPALAPYMGMQRPYQPQPVKQEVVKVNGENGARAFSMGPNSSALLLDESGTLVWLVTTDGAGYKSVSPFDINPHEAAPAPDFADLETRITRLEAMIHATADTAAPRTEQQQPSSYTAFTGSAEARTASADDRHDQKRR